MLCIWAISVSQSYATMEDGSGGWKVNVTDIYDKETKTIDTHECEKYPERCKDEVKVQIEWKALTNEDDKDTWVDDAIDTAQDYNSTRSNRRKNEMWDVDDDGDRAPTRYERWVNELWDKEIDAWDRTQSHNSSRSNRTEWIRMSDVEIEDCRWNPPKCRDELEARMMESQIKVRTDDEVWCWGRAWSHCSPEVREERREILKERLNVKEAQYNRLQRQLEPRVSRLFQRLSEEERDTLSERLASLVEQHQESSNARLLAAILVLQELLESVE